MDDTSLSLKGTERDARSPSRSTSLHSCKHACKGLGGWCFLRHRDRLIGVNCGVITVHDTTDSPRIRYSTCPALRGNLKLLCRYTFLQSNPSPYNVYGYCVGSVLQHRKTPEHRTCGPNDSRHAACACAIAHVVVHGIDFSPYSVV